MSGARPTPADVLAAARGGYGAGLLLGSAAGLSRIARMPLDGAAITVARVLGARELVQAAWLAGAPSPSALLAGAGVDALHSASMVLLARGARRPAHRVLAARNARSAAILALGGAAAAAAAHRTAPRRGGDFLSQ
jgi:hypothetical protein